MQTLQRLRKQIDSATDLRSVVKTMKSLAAVNIRQYENAVDALGAYNETVELALRAALGPFPGVESPGAARPDKPRSARGKAAGPVGFIVIGTDQGMCGQVNEQVFSLAMDAMIEAGRGRGDPIAAVGERVAEALAEEAAGLETPLEVPGSVEGITEKVNDLILRIDIWNREHGVEEVSLCHARFTGGASFEPVVQRLLPVDREWLRRVGQKPWPTRMLPLVPPGVDRGRLARELLRHYLFILIYRGLAESLASENASRLASMQGAEKNIEKRLASLTASYHQQRQTSITGELLDIVSGFEALREEEADETSA